MSSVKRAKLAHYFNPPQLVYRADLPTRTSDYIIQKGTESRPSNTTPMESRAVDSRLSLLRSYLIMILFLISILVPGLTLFFPRFATHFYLRLSYTAVLSLILLIVFHFTHASSHWLHSPAEFEYAYPF
jgi:hypothetical protein